MVKNVCFTLDEKSHAIAAAKAATLGLTISAMAKALITRTTLNSDGIDSSENSDGGGQNCERVKISLARTEKESIAYHAKINNWSMSRECRFRIISSLSASPKLRPVELQKITGLRSAIDTIGRNLRHMVLNKKLEVADPGFMEEIEQLNQHLIRVKKEIDELCLATTDRWEFNLRKMKSTYL